VSLRVADFGDAVARDVEHAGGKAVRLAEMAHAGLPVPPGFAVCAGAWRELLDHRDGELHRTAASVLDELGVRPGPGRLEDAAARLHDLVMAAPVPDGVEEEVAAAYAALGERLGTTDPPVAVRSSATLEDAAADSFAGQFETYLWVSGAASVMRSVQRCWAGMFNASGLAYVAQRGMGALQGAMAVAVQSMVRSRTSGVMFTLDPMTGDRSLVSIEGSWGLGSAVVGGEVTPDRYVVAKPTMAIRERRVHAKDVRHVPDADRGTRAEAVPAGLREAPCLSDEEVLELARLARAIEGLYGAAQDIEWAIDERLEFPGSILILQARPETVWSRRRDEPVLDPAGDALGWIAQTLSKGA
jgi:pyruvate,water dikinase